MLKMLGMRGGLLFFVFVIGVLNVSCPGEEQGAALLSALFEGDVEGARVLFEREPTEVVRRGGWSLWNNVIHGGHIESANFLLEKKVDVNACGPAGIRPLHLAAGETNADIVKLLLAYSAEVNVYCMDTHCVPRWTPLHYAARYGCPEVVKLLLKEGAEVNVADRDGAIPLHHAAAYGALENLEALLVRGAVVNIGDNTGLTPLHYAVYQGRVGYAEMLLQRGANVNVCDFEDRTPLHCAASRGFPRTVMLLLENKATVDVRDSNGRTPLHYAALSGCWPAAKALLQFGAEIEAIDEDNRTALQLATDARVICVLVEAGADIRKISKQDSNYEMVRAARRKRRETRQANDLDMQAEPLCGSEQDVNYQGAGCRKRCRINAET
jgi:ankyrin repeat protein